MGLLPRRHVAVSVLLHRVQCAYGEPEVGGIYARRSALRAQLPRRPAPIVCHQPLGPTRGPGRPQVQGCITVLVSVSSQEQL
jgi:hypothetical protein